MADPLYILFIYLFIQYLKRCILTVYVVVESLFIITHTVCEVLSLVLFCYY